MPFHAWKENVFLFVITLFSAMIIIGLLGCGKQEVQEEHEVVRPAKLMTVKDVNEVLVQGFPGTVRAARRAVLSFKVSGRLLKLPVEEGQLVKRGDLIAQLDQRDFLNEVRAARAKYREAEQQFKRYKELYAKRQVSRADFDRYQAARDVAKAKLEEALNRLKDTRLLAPFDGYISKRYVENYYEVKAKEPIVNLQDVSKIEILVNLPELTMAAVKEENLGEIIARFDAIPGKSFPLRVKEYSTEADPATQTYQVVFVMDQPNGANILPGMTATVIAAFKEGAGSKPRIIIPDLAVLDAPTDRPYVWLFDPTSGTVHKRFVRIGRLVDSGGILIQEGLKPGDQIVVAGVTKLEEGMKVRPWELQREGK